MRLKSADRLVESEHVSAALEEIESLLEKGDPEAHALAGIIYEFGGKGVETDFGKACYCYEFAANATGSGAACLGLARLYFHGKGRPVDLHHAHFIYECMRVENNEPIAFIGLARIYLQDNWPRDDLDKAEEYLLLVMRQGYVSSYFLYARLLRKKRRWLRAIYYELAGRLLALKIILADRGDIRLCSE